MVSIFNGKRRAAADLDAIVSSALVLWQRANPDAAGMLNNVKVQLADLPGNALGEAAGNTVLIDINAAGARWFVDRTPLQNEEYVTGPDGLVAGDFTGAGGRVDLLTVIVHEFGHVMGLDHDHESEGAAHSLMDDTLLPEIRRLPSVPVSHEVPLTAPMYRYPGSLAVKDLVHRFGHQLPGMDARKPFIAPALPPLDLDPKGKGGEPFIGNDPLLSHRIFATTVLQDSPVNRSVAHLLNSLDGAGLELVAQNE